MSSSNLIHDIMDANRLTRTNFNDWLRNLKILLRSKHIEYVLERKGPYEPATIASEEDIWENQKWKDNSTTVGCFMLASTRNEVQRQHEEMQPRAVLLHL